MIDKDFKLSTIPYKRVDIESVEREVEILKKEFNDASSADKQLEVYKELYKLLGEAFTNIVLVYIRYGCNIKDEFYKKENDYINEILPKVEELESQCKKLLYNSKYKKELKETLGEAVFENIEVMLKSFSDKLIPLKQEENRLMSQYSRLLAELRVNYKGEEYSLFKLNKYIYSENRKIRKEAEEAKSKVLISIQDELDNIFDELVTNRNKQAKVMGYENFVKLGDYTVRRKGYARKEIKEFREAIKRYLVPKVKMMQKERKKRLGLDELNFIDEGIYFREGNPKVIGDADYIFRTAKKMYSEMSEETKEFFEFMLRHELFEVFPRENKEQGGYSTMLKAYKAPLIYGNFNGTDSDVGLIIHECGHAFQGYLTRNYEIEEFNEITYEIAEVHSMTMEYFADKWMELFFGDRADDYRKMHMEGQTLGIINACMADEFQEIIYTNPNLTLQERNDIWKGLESEYKPYVNYYNDGFYNKGRRWQLQSHIYTTPFYYIDYALAEVCALQFKEKMDIDFNDAWERYVMFCLESAKDYFINTVEKVGLKNPFKEETLKEIVENL